MIAEVKAGSGITHSSVTLNQLRPAPESVNTHKKMSGKCTDIVLSSHDISTYARDTSHEDTRSTLAQNKSFMVL